MKEITFAEAIIRNRRTLIILGTLAFLGVVSFFLLIYSEKILKKERGGKKRRKR